jgi:hypothetical protein
MPAGTRMPEYSSASSPAVSRLLAPPASFTRATFCLRWSACSSETSITKPVRWYPLLPPTSAAQSW